MRRAQDKVAVILVNWNGFADTAETLASLGAARREKPPGDDWWVLVVDNGSTDDSVARLQALERERGDFELLETGENLGFAGGNDYGLRRAAADPEIGWFLLLNTDVKVATDFLEPLVETCLEPEVGAAGPKIYYAEPPDRLWAAGGRLRLRETVTKELGRGEIDGPRWNRGSDVTYLTTCCLLIPRDVLVEVGLLDPVYFINVDDADWCRRALDAGYRLRYVPESRIWHKVAQSTGGGYTPSKTFHTGRGNALFVRRHCGLVGLFAFLAANAVALSAAWIRELPRGNTAAVLSKARGIWRGLFDPLPDPPTLW